MRRNVVLVDLVIQVKSNAVKGKALIAYLCLLLCLVSCGSTRTTAGGTAACRKYDYYFMQALKSKLAARYDEAYELFRHCEFLDPSAAEVQYELGLFHESLGEKKESERYLERAVALEPDNIDYKEALASLYLKEFNPDKAMPMLEDMVRCNPSRSDVIAQLINMYLSNKMYREAIEALSRLEVLEGRSTPISMEKFRLYRELGEVEKGFEELEELAAEYPNDPSYRLIIADRYLAEGQQDKAWEIYEEVASVEPELPALQLSLLSFYEATRQDSLYSLQWDVVMYSEQTEERVRVAMLRDWVVKQEQAGKDSSDILYVFNRVLEVVPASVDVWVLYASYLEMKKMDLELYVALLSILVLEPDHRMALVKLMQKSLQEGNYEDAIEYCEGGIRYYPDVLAFYYYQGFSYYLLGEPDKALDIFSKGVRQPITAEDAPLAADMYSIIGDLRYEAGQVDAAFAAYDSCLIYKPDNIACLNNYAYYLSLLYRDLDKAEQMSRRTIIMEPDNKTYLDTYAWVLFVQGKAEEAKVYIDKVLEGDIDGDERISSGVLEHAGDIYYICGDAEKALFYWKKAWEKGAEDASPLLREKIQTKKYVVPWRSME